MTKQNVFNNKAKCIQLAKKQQIMLLESIQEFTCLNEKNIEGKKYDGHIVNKINTFLKSRRGFVFSLNKMKDSILLTISVESFTYTDFQGKTAHIPLMENIIEIPMCASVYNQEISTDNIYDICAYRIEKLKQDIEKWELAISNYGGAEYTRNKLIKQIEDYRSIYGDILFYDLKSGDEKRF